MAGENDFLKFNNGQEFRFSNFKEIREEDLKNADAETKRLFNIFAGDDRIMQANEAESLWDKLKSAATSNKNGDNSVFEDDEMQKFLDNDSDIKTLSVGKPFTLNNLTELISNIFVKSNNVPITTATPKESAEACQNAVIGIISDNLAEARMILMSQHLGAISGSYDEHKDEDDKLKTSNVQKVLDYQTAGTTQMYKAQEGTLTRRAYYEEN